MAGCQFQAGAQHDTGSSFLEWRQSAGFHHLAATADHQDGAGHVPQLEHAAGRNLSSAVHDQSYFLEQSRFAPVRGGRGGFSQYRRRFRQLLSDRAPAMMTICMLQMIKRYFWIAPLASGLQTSWGFALLGPLTLANGADALQRVVIGYDLPYTDDFLPGDPEFLGDIGGPRNIGEEYRRNVPVLYYTYDQTFLNFFGADGAGAVDGAYAIMNSVPKADKMDLSQYPLVSTQPNFTAHADFLTGLKSETRHLLVEQLGLADPERFVWTLHDRVVLPGTTCPLGEVY